MNTHKRNWLKCFLKTGPMMQFTAAEQIYWANVSRNVLLVYKTKTNRDMWSLHIPNSVMELHKFQDYCKYILLNLSLFLWFQQQRLIQNNLLGIILFSITNSLSVVWFWGCIDGGHLRRSYLNLQKVEVINMSMENLMWALIPVCERKPRKIFLSCYTVIRVDSMSCCLLYFNLFLCYNLRPLLALFGLYLPYMTLRRTK
jgi:hypothetical protein